ncbi:MAG TPA: adenylyl-sulfate kinase [Nitrospirae bacterium]|nr:putative adenylyl-sulfate kinase [bacterium BMS3Abin06]HDH11407.1 adenylyl-sulfate kinase [Nitrospirota bacterium]HDZ01439.1 adenylyl-sulfate kinase [Nitrospirota bacterium]
MNPIIWIMGPTSSGKTTLATGLLKKIRGAQIKSITFDGDEVRDFFGKDIGFEPADRLRVVSTIVHLSNKAREAGLVVIVSALTANQDARDYILEQLNEYLIVYVDCSIKACAKRDPKGLYALAENGAIDSLIGFNNDYLPPVNPDIVIQTESETKEESINCLIEYLKKCHPVIERNI